MSARAATAKAVTMFLSSPGRSSLQTHLRLTRCGAAMRLSRGHHGPLFFGLPNV